MRSWIINSSKLLLIVAGFWAMQAPVAGQGQLPQVLTVGLSLDGETVLTAGDRIRIFEAATGQLIQQLEPPKTEVTSTSGRIRTGLTRVIRVSPVDGSLYATGGDGGEIRLWRIGEDQPVREFVGHFSEVQDQVPRLGIITDMQFSPDGKWLATCGMLMEQGMPFRGELRLWEVETGKELHAISVDKQGIDAVAFSPHGTRLALARGTRQRSSEAFVEIYDIAAWQSQKTISFGLGFANGLTFSGDGATLWVVGGECVPLGDGCIPTGHIWKVTVDESQHVELVATDSRNYFRGIALSNDGESFITGASALHNRKASDGSQRWTSPSAIGEIYGASLSASGDRAAYCQFSQITVLEAATGKKIHQFKVTAP